MSYLVFGAKANPSPDQAYTKPKPPKPEYTQPKAAEKNGAAGRT